MYDSTVVVLLAELEQINSVYPGQAQNHHRNIAANPRLRVYQVRLRQRCRKKCPARLSGDRLLLRFVCMGSLHLRPGIRLDTHNAGVVVVELQ